ncbi:MAG: hypothetical protein QY326_05370 [Bdellovibrionota bacterium]|nr:MAG: hypothetical protein QY326_05370 [Bdellovibrionota bacterium]
MKLRVPPDSSRWREAEKELRSLRGPTALKQALRRGDFQEMGERGRARRWWWIGAPSVALASLALLLLLRAPTAPLASDEDLILLFEEYQDFELGVGANDELIGSDVLFEELY